VLLNYSVVSFHVECRCADATTASFDIKKAFANVHRDLIKKYPGHIVSESDLEWVFLNAGGFMGSICVLHASLTEYILFFGTAIDTSGHSGSYLCYLITLFPLNKTCSISVECCAICELMNISL